MLQRYLELPVCALSRSENHLFHPYSQARTAGTVELSASGMIDHLSASLEDKVQRVRAEVRRGCGEMRGLCGGLWDGREGGEPQPTS